MLNIFRYFTIFVMLSAIALTSCDVNDYSINSGRLRVKLTDATDVSIKELHIDISSIAVYATDTLNMEGEWVTLDYNGGEYNILNLLNGSNVQLVDQYFPAGKVIRKARLVFGHNNRFVTFTAEPYQLQLPSDIRDGVVVDLIEPVVMMPSIISHIVLDINAAFSVTKENDNYFLNPHIRAFPENYGASLRGFVSPAEFAAFVGIAKDSEVLFTLPEQDGRFLFPGLERGEWEVYIATVPGSNYTDTSFVWSIDTTGIVDITPKPINLTFTPD